MLDQLESLLRQHGVQIRNATPLEKADARCLVSSRAFRTTPTGRIPPDPSSDEIKASAAEIEVTLTEAARGFGVELDAVDKPAATSAPIRGA